MVMINGQLLGTNETKLLNETHNTARLILILHSTIHMHRITTYDYMALVLHTYTYIPFYQLQFLQFQIYRYVFQQDSSSLDQFEHLNNTYFYYNFNK